MVSLRLQTWATAFAFLAFLTPLISLFAWAVVIFVPRALRIAPPFEAAPLLLVVVLNALCLFVGITYLLIGRARKMRRVLLQGAFMLSVGVAMGCINFGALLYLVSISD